MNISIAILNSGFIMSQLGHDFKKYLLMINNNNIASIGPQ